MLTTVSLSGNILPYRLFNCIAYLFHCSDRDAFQIGLESSSDKGSTGEAPETEDPGPVDSNSLSSIAKGRNHDVATAKEGPVAAAAVNSAQVADLYTKDEEMMLAMGLPLDFVSRVLYTHCNMMFSL